MFLISEEDIIGTLVYSELHIKGRTGGRYYDLSSMTRDLNKAVEVVSGIDHLYNHQFCWLKCKRR